MNDNQNAIQPYNEDLSNLNLDELEASLDADLENSLADLELLKEDREKIGNPDSLSETVMNVVWEQFINQVGAVAGEEFIQGNRGLTLDLRPSAHIQTTNNFEKGKIASRNPFIDYQERYDKWQEKLAHDDNGNIITYTDRTGIPKPRLAGKHVRKPFDSKRPTGSKERGTDMDHTVSADEIICDPQANAHLTEAEQIKFANSNENLNEMNASHNRSKGPRAMNDWLDNTNKNGQKPDEIFDDLTEDVKTKYREKDKEARAKYKEEKQKGEQNSIKTGVKSWSQEAGSLSKKALQGIVMTLLAALVKEIFQKFAVWLKSKQKSLSSFLTKVKEAIGKFVNNLKHHLKMAAQTAVGAIASMIFGPIVRTLQKTWTFLKQGYKSFKEAIEYTKNPENKKKPFSILMMEVGKIIIAGASAVGAIVLAGTIEGSLSTVPFFAFEIPMLGSLASILGLFIGGLISGLIGAIALNLIDRWIAQKQKSITTGKVIEKSNEILKIQTQIVSVSSDNLKEKKITTADNIVTRHQQASSSVLSTIIDIESNLSTIEDDMYLMDITPSTNSSAIEDLNKDIDNI